MEYTWSEEKNKQLKAENRTDRLGFDEIIADGELVDILVNPKYENQELHVFKVRGKIYVIAVVKEDYFCKTAYRNKKLDKKY